MHFLWDACSNAIGLVILGAKENFNATTRGASLFPEEFRRFPRWRLVGDSRPCLRIVGLHLMENRWLSPLRESVAIFDESRWLSSTNLGVSHLRIPVAILDGVNRWLSRRCESAVVAEFNWKVNSLSSLKFSFLHVFDFDPSCSSWLFSPIISNTKLKKRCWSTVKIFGSKI